MAQILDKSSASTYVEPSEKPITTVTVYQGYQTGRGVHDTTTFTVDREIGAAYFRLKQAKGEVESIEFDAQAILDVDKTGQAVGLELLFGSKEALDALLLSLKEGSDKR